MNLHDIPFRLPDDAVDMMLSFGVPGDLTTVVRDVAGGWRRLPLPDAREVLCLSSAGTAISVLGSLRSRIRVEDLVSPAPAVEFAVGRDILGCALSPAARHAALLLDAYDRVEIAELDLVTGDTRPIFDAPGGSSAETVVSFSPDGNLIAATFLSLGDDGDDDGDEDSRTVVVDRAGDVRADLRRCVLTRSGNGSWLTAGELVIGDDDSGAFQVHDVGTSARRALPAPAGVPVAVRGRALVCYDVGGRRLLEQDLRGGQPRVIGEFADAAHLHAVDVARTTPGPQD